jgi:hypothetical protein
MEIKNFCVVIMGDTKNAFYDIEKISDDKPNILDAKGIVIATLTSALTVKEITEWFKLKDRSFLVFELDENVSGYNITKKEIHDGLFGHLINSDEKLNKRISEFINAIEDAKIIEEEVKYNKKQYVDVKKVVKVKRLTESDIENMTIREKQEAMNKIIDSGVENLTDYDKKMLTLLAK